MEELTRLQKAKAEICALNSNPQDQGIIRWNEFIDSIITTKGGLIGVPVIKVIEDAGVDIGPFMKLGADLIIKLESRCGPHDEKLLFLKSIKKAI